MAKYAKVKKWKRGVPNTTNDDAKYRTCLRCGKIAKVSALNVTHLIIEVRYCEGHAIQGGVIAAV